MPTIKKTALIIGAGTGGYPCAIRLGQLGVDTMLVEKAEPGGVCLNWGCVPSKALISATKLFHKAQHADHMGLSFASPSADMSKMQGWKSGIVKKLTGGIKTLVKGAGTQYVKATAEILGPGRVKLVYPAADNKPDDIVECQHLVIATGSLPIQIPGFAIDQKRVCDSTGALDLDFVPEHLVCIGGGIIGLELGQAMTRLGVRTRIFDIADHLGVLPSPIMRERAQTLLAKELDLQLGVDELTVDVVEDGLQLSWTDNEGRAQRDEFEYVLAATGRRPQLERLDLAAAEVELDERGMPKGWDPRTGQIGEHPIFLAGDVVGDRPLLHEAAAEGRIAGINAGRWPEVRALVRYTPLAIVFSDPQIALVGTIPSEDPDDPARDWEFGEVDLSSQGRARVMAVNQGFIRVYAKHACGKLIGAEILGPRAEHLAHLLAWSIEQGLTAQRALTMPYYHPVIEEGLRTAMQELAAKLKLIARAQPLDCGPGA
ncbi:MAG: dihydrolipoyl dehydrogenase [Myxococcales bacterium]|nr:dihydrolipoyl dehydrogenase [Myxococcales bacterium]